MRAQTGTTAEVTVASLIDPSDTDRPAKVHVPDDLVVAPGPVRAWGGGGRDGGDESSAWRRDHNDRALVRSRAQIGHPEHRLVRTLLRGGQHGASRNNVSANIFGMLVLPSRQVSKLMSYESRKSVAVC